MANEFIIKNGYISKGNSVVENGFTATTISATTYFNLPSSTFTGGTVTGSTIFTNGLSANTISATTYQNLPISALTEGSNISLTNSSGNYTISVTGITSGGSFTGGTVTGPTVFLSGVSANTLTVNGVNITGDTYTTGGTYSNGTIQFNYNTGGGYQVTGLYTGQTSYVNSLTTGTGLSANTTTGDITIINTSPDQTVTITGGTNVSINGTYPNFGIELTGLTDNNRYTTGFTYNDNTFTISDNSGSTYSATFNTVTGLTVNGILNVTGNTIQSGVTATTIYTDYIDFNTGATVTQSPGRISWDSGTGTLNVTVGDGVTGLIDLEVGQEEIVRVYNEEATTLQKGEIVYVYGSQGNRPSVKRAQAQGDLYSVTTLGMVDIAIPSGSEGYVTTFGIISNLNTSGLTGGTPVWLSPTTPGAYTSTKPQAPDHTVLIGYVVRVDINVGSIFVNISNGWELDELHDVRISAATEGDLLVRSSYSGTPVWVNTKTLPGSYTITGDTNIESNLNVTGSTTVTSLNLTTLPTTNNTEDSFLVRNTTSGEIQIRTLDSIFDVKNQVTVGLPGSVGVDFNSIKDAIDSITGASSTNVYVVRVGPGVYNENPITMKSYVAILGESSVSTIINANNPNQPLINAVDNSFISDVLIQGCTGTSVSAIMYSSSTSVASSAIVYVENVRFGSNYTHVTNFPFGGGNTAIQCTNIKYGAQPFTLGFYMTSDGSSTGRFQLRNVTTTAGGVANTSGLTFAKVDQPNCTIIGNLVTVTKAGSAPVSGIGFHVENGGLLRLNGFNIQRFGTGIYVPQVGSAPTIDAVGLNFENCTTDVDIIHSGTTGKVNGTDSFLKTKININAPLYEVNQDPKQIVVAKKGGDFSSIKSAVDYLAASGNTSSTNRFIITVGPGIFNEGEIDLTNTPYVSIVGSNIQTTLITPTGSTQHIIKIGQNNEVSFLSLSGASAGYAGIYAYDIGDFGQAHKISMYDCDTGIWVESDTQETVFYGEYIDMNGEYTYGTKSIANNNFVSLVNLENYYIFPGNSGTTGNYVSGSGSTINLTSSSLNGLNFTGTTAINLRDGGFCNMASTDVTSWGYGLKIENVGDSSSFEINGTTFADNTLDIDVQQSSASGVFQGISNHQKVTTISENVYWSFLDSDDGELDITRKASVTFTDGSHTDFTTLVFEGSTMGVLSGGSISTVAGTTIQADAGFGYLEKTDNSGIVRRIDWSNSQITLSANTDNYIFINENSILSKSGSKPSSSNNIILGRVVTNSTDVEIIDLTPVNAEHTSNRFDNLFTEALGPIYANGSIVTEGTTAFTLNVTAGEYYFSTNEILPTGGTGITFTQYYRNGTGSTWITSATTLVNNTQFDNNGTLSALTTNYYTKHTLYVLGEGIHEKYFLVLGQNQYSSLVEAEDALLPTPPSYFTDSIAQISNIYVKQGDPNIVQLEDIRPTISFRAGGVNASSTHGNLLGLTNDDHTQYLLVDGSRAMAGNLDLNVNDIVNVGLVDGVQVSTHASRHKFGGADPVGTVTPSANAIPFADVNGTLDSWVSTATTTTLGRVKLSTSPVSASDPIVVGENDLRFTNSLTGVSYSNNTFTFPKVDGTNVVVPVNTMTGLTINGNLNVTGTTTIETLSLPTNNNNSTQILVRNSSTGELEYIDSTTTVIGKFNYGMANAMISGNVLI